VQWDDLNGDGIAGPSERVLRRRVLLIRPDLDLSGYSPTTISGTTTYSFFNSNDISARPVLDSSGNLVMRANSLADLSQRENRFAHDARVIGSATAPTFPYRLDSAVLSALAQTGNRLGEDILLSNLLACDVRAYDPTALLVASPGPDGAWGQVGLDDDGDGTVDNVTEAGWAGSDDLATIPGDPAWSSAGAAIGQGAYVDLNYSSYAAGASSIFSGTPQAKSWLNATGGLPVMATYDTWSFWYERNGSDDDGDGTTDEGTNGLDDDNNNGVDDLGERETSPPYPYPLRGLQVRIRIYEPDTRQMRQATVAADFVPD
jgi:hypothetical protein